PSQRTTWPPSAAVRQALIAEMARSWPRLTCPLLAAHHAAPWARKMSATSMGSPVSRRLRLKARKLPDKSSYPVTEPFDPGSLSVAISSLDPKRASAIRPPLRCCNCVRNRGTKRHVQCQSDQRRAVAGSRSFITVSYGLASSNIDETDHVSGRGPWDLFKR